MNHKTDVIDDVGMVNPRHKAEPLWWVGEDWPTLLRNHWSWAAPMLYLTLAIVGMVLACTS